MMVKQRAELTFKNNLNRGRHGWVRLTPAYSVRLVKDLIAQNSTYNHVLDPFSGTGTTGLTCAQMGIRATLLDINPFLVWLAQVKTANYTKDDRNLAKKITKMVVDIARVQRNGATTWTPPIYNIHRWWSPDRLSVLASIYQQILKVCAHKPTYNLLLIAFCRLVIDWSNAAFNHQSMSFRDAQKSIFDESEMIFSAFIEAVDLVTRSATEQISETVDVFLCDSRELGAENERMFDCVITSPPYANRMSYIRELRPYMYWLGYLNATSDAGELDWQAIGGTWGIATSRLKDWESSKSFESSYLQSVVSSIAKSSETLANYVHKYADDMYSHFLCIKKRLTAGAELYYIVGNSKFYDTLVSVENLYAEMMRDVGFLDINITPIRKRNSKKELFEYMVFARNP